MSIIILKSALFSLRLVKLAIFTIIFFLAMSLIPHFTITVKAECYAVSGSCSILGDKFYPLDDPSKCTLNDVSPGYMPRNTYCCCTKSYAETTKPKYLIITSVTAFFAILTALVYFYKKNE